MKLIKPKEFTVKLSSVGTDSCSSNYNKIKSESALIACLVAIDKMTEDMVGKDNSLTLKYHLSCALLSGIEGYKDLQKDIKESKKFIEYWKLKQGGKGKG